MKTILLIYSVSNIVMTVVIYFAWRKNRSRFEGVSNWLMSFFMQTLGMNLILMRNIIPDFISIVVSNFLSILGSVLFYFGVALFLNENIRKKPYYVVAGVFFILQTYFGFIEPSLQARIILFFLIKAFIAFQCARLFYKSSDIKMKRNYRLTGRIMFFYVMIYLSRIIYYIFRHAGLEFFKSDFITSLMIIIGQTMRIAVTFSILMMINKKLVISLEDESLEREKLLKNFRNLSRVDGLTKLWNRKTIEGKLREEFLRSQRYNIEISVILLDVDYFKRINDTFGHPVGDFVLEKIAETLKANLRKTDFIGRWGGEEFVVVCIETGEKNVWKISEKLRKAVAGHDFGLDRQVTLSLGYATLNNGENVDDLLKRVDVNMYSAKKSGRNRTEPNIGFKEKTIESAEGIYDLII